MDFETTWQRALEHSKDILGEDDFELVRGFASLQELLAEVARLEQRYNDRAVPRLLHSIRPHLTRLQYFASFLMVSTGATSFESAFLWGMTCLLIQLASNSDESLERVSSYLSDLGQRLRLFEVYNGLVHLEQEDIGDFFDLLVELLLDCASAIKYFRKNDFISAIGWSNVDARFTKTLANFSGRLKNLKQLAEARSLALLNQKQEDSTSRLLLRMDEMGLENPSTSRTAQLPCWHLPFGRNPAFYGRARVLDELNEALSSNDRKGFRSAALWGTGGIGKSQTALEYANAQIQSGCKIVIWLPSESENELTSALVNAAKKLQPPGYTESCDPDTIRLLMWDWMEKTDESWLLIFDNIENNDLLLKNWPVAGAGQVIVTCRSELIAASPAAKAIEIPAFTTEEGGELLLQLANRSSNEPGEVLAAQEIANMLGGLALGIDITARQIFVKKKTMQEFLPYFIENRPSLRTPPRYAARNPYYSKNLANVWQSAFEQLSEAAASMMSILCFLSPDGIPRSIFFPKTTELSGKFGLLNDVIMSEEAQEELLFNSLIRVNESQGTMSIHRLTQEAFYYAMTDAERFEGFVAAFRILAEAFPKRVQGRHMYVSWTSCEPLIHHVSALSSKYADMQTIGFDLQDPAWAILIADATWYCAETQALHLGEMMGLKAAESWTDKASPLYAYLCESVGTVAHRRGQYVVAHKYFEQALRVRASDPTTPTRVLADSESAVGLALLGLFRCEEAIAAVGKALGMALATSEEERRTYNYDRYLRNLARPKVELDRFVEAEEDLDRAEAFQTKVYGPNSHFHGETAYIRGIIALKRDDLDAAAELFQRAFDLCSPGKPTHDSLAAARYQQALVCLRRKQDLEQNRAQAMQHLRYALKIAEFNEKRRGDLGGAARVKWHIAKILKSQGSLSEAATYEASAVKIKLELELTGLYPTAPSEDRTWDCFCDLLYR